MLTDAIKIETVVTSIHLQFDSILKWTGAKTVQTDVPKLHRSLHYSAAPQRDQPVAYLFMHEKV